MLQKKYEDPTILLDDELDLLELECKVGYGQHLDGIYEQEIQR
ncbi:MAG: hypothetical protein ACXAEI_16405 [Candidatus Hodarchaeales archaeon]